MKGFMARHEYGTIFQPCIVICVLVQVFWRHAMALAFDHVAKAAIRRVMQPY